MPRKLTDVLTPLAIGRLRSIGHVYGGRKAYACGTVNKLNVELLRAGLIQAGEITPSARGPEQMFFLTPTGREAVEGLFAPPAATPAGRKPATLRPASDGDDEWSRVPLSDEDFQDMLKDRRKGYLNPWDADDLCRMSPAQAAEYEAAWQPRIYVARCGMMVKIGYTAQPVETRINNLQTGSPERIVLLRSFPGDQKLEKKLHTRFREQRRQGEWFRLEGGIARWIKAGCPL